ncbi:MAG: hypothetical protein AAF738_01175 [Bacteroidota bacterium]
MNIKTYLTASFCLMLCLQLSAQHGLDFLQYQQTPMLINPALTTNFNAEQRNRLSANYRFPGSSVFGNSQEHYGLIGYEHRLQLKNSSIGLGASHRLFYYDDSVNTNLFNSTRVALSYNKPLNSHSILSGGINVDFTSGYTSVGFGGAWKYYTNNQNNLTAGLALSDIRRGTSNLKGHVAFNFAATKKLRMEPNLLYQNFLSSAIINIHHIVAGNDFQWALNDKQHLHLGISYLYSSYHSESFDRSDTFQSLLASVGYSNQNFTIRVSYDDSVSDLTPVTYAGNRLEVATSFTF